MAGSDIGIYGLGVMGRNLALNFARRGHAVSVYNRDAPGEEDLVAVTRASAEGMNVYGAAGEEDFVNSLAPPRKIFLMVTAGPAVDQVLDRLVPLCRGGDIIIDGGNSHYRDTERRIALLGRAGLHFVGCGVSGGREGALNGPCMMPGGDARAWPAVRDILGSAAARLDDGTPCCAWIGAGGAGQFVKMVHNGIEYGMMQSIAEAYDVMKRLLGMPYQRIGAVLSEWNNGDAGGFLLNSAADILSRQGEDGVAPLEEIADRAAQKGTGRDALAASFELDVPVPVICEAVLARFLSAMDAERRAAAGSFAGPAPFSGDRQALLRDAGDALYCTQLVACAQGLALIGRASGEFGWDIDLPSVARIWGGGCIIQSSMMKEIAAACAGPAGGSVLLYPRFIEALDRKQAGWRRAAAAAQLHGLPVPATASALAYFDGYRSGRLPADLIQAMRDYFGAHGYERVGGPPGALFRTDWKKR